MLPEILRDDFRKFLYVVWKHLQLPEPTPIQYAMAHYLQHGPSRLMIQAFRGVGKSWILAAFCLWCLARNPQLNILVYSASKQRSDAFTQFCLRLIDEMEILHFLKPREGQRCSMVAFDVGPARASQSPSMMSVGIFGNATGMRADLILADDVEVPNNSETQLQREKLAERTKEFDAILKPTGRIIWLGTPQCEDSIYNDIPERGFDVRIWPVRYPDEALRAAYGTRLAPQIRAAVEANPNLVGLTTEPARFSNARLAEVETAYGAAGFGLQFMLDPRRADADTYPLRLCDLMVHPLDMEVAPERLIWSSAPENVENQLPSDCMRSDRIHKAVLLPNTNYVPYQGTVMAIDPSGRGKDETGWAVVSAVNRQLYLRAAGGEPGYDDSSLKKLCEIARDYKVNEIVVEPNYGGGMFNELLKSKLREVGYRCAVSDSKWSTGQKERRIIDILEPILTSHRLIVDRDLVRKDFESVSSRPLETARQYRLFYQLTRVTRIKGCLNHDDRLEALSIAVMYWKDLLAGDIEQAIKQGREEAQKKELEKFLDNVFGHKRQKPTWYGHLSKPS